MSQNFFKKLMAKKGRPLVMGILNVTPDSFSDGGTFYSARRARARALQMVREGADIIDIGGESTRPGARLVSADLEISRVVPAIKTIARSIGVPISVDTRKARVAEAAIVAGAAIINDVSGLRFDPRMAHVVSRTRAAVIIMHSRGTPGDMQKKTRYRDLVGDVARELRESADIARRAGCDENVIAVDPGIGFAKTAEQSFALLSDLHYLKKLGYPICVGVSRKSCIGAATGRQDPAGRLAASIAASTIAIMNGADIVRVHDVKETADAVAVAASIVGFPCNAQ